MIKNQFKKIGAALTLCIVALSGCHSQNANTNTDETITQNTNTDETITQNNNTDETTTQNNNTDETITQNNNTDETQNNNTDETTAPKTRIIPCIRNSNGTCTCPIDAQPKDNQCICKGAVHHNGIPLPTQDGFRIIDNTPVLLGYYNPYKDKIRSCFEKEKVSDEVFDILKACHVHISISIRSDGYVHNDASLNNCEALRGKFGIGMLRENLIQCAEDALKEVHFCPGTEPPDYDCKCDLTKNEYYVIDYSYADNSISINRE